MSKAKVKYSKLHTNETDLKAKYNSQNNEPSQINAGARDVLNTRNVFMDYEAYEMGELRRTRNGRKTGEMPAIKHGETSKTSIIEIPVTGSESLQGLSLRFGCAVAEIKRCNNIYKNQELYALDKIKIPVSQYSVLTDTFSLKDHNLPSLENCSEDSPESNSEYNQDSSVQESTGEVRTVSIRTALDSPNSFLQQMDNDLAKICNSTPIRKATLEEVTRTLTVNSIQPPRTKDDMLGTVCGCGWKGIVAGLVIIAIIGIPVLYYLVRKKLEKN